tara:strand:- start:1084 stop:1287 length:204 start_codon:yes stop_codon:yes gene_type:complete
MPISARIFINGERFLFCLKVLNTSVGYSNLITSFKNRLSSLLKTTNQSLKKAAPIIINTAFCLFWTA